MAVSFGKEHGYCFACTTLKRANNTPATIYARGQSCSPGSGRPFTWMVYEECSWPQSGKDLAVDKVVETTYVEGFGPCGAIGARSCGWCFFSWSVT